MAELDRQYATLIFNVRKDDLLLLYIDSLYEKKNTAGKEFGPDLILSFF